ncbi:MAG: EAL domain-containing protein [Pseudomonadota bacterium]
MLQLNRISTKLGAIYASLFAAMMLVIALVTYATVTDRARIIVSDQVVASSQVFTHLFVERGADLQKDTDLQVRDYGFRSAVTSENQPTVLSALETLRQRLAVDGLALVDNDGAELAAVGAELPLTSLSAQVSENAYDEIDHAPGVVIYDEQAVLSGYVGVFAPNLIGFVVFGDVISDSDIAEIAELSSIPLEVAILPKRDGEQMTGEVQTLGGRLHFRHEIPALVDEQPIVLELTYPLSVAFAPFRALLITLILVALAGAFIISGASWFVARRVARPISHLAEAADLVRGGKEASVSVNTGDELQDLATAFNHMSSEIQAREGELKLRARRDPETGLPNRRAFEEALMDDAEMSSYTVVLAIGIDRFSEIRSALGFEASAALLNEVFESLEAHSGTGFTGIVSGDVLAASFKCKPGSTIEDCTLDLRNQLNTAFRVQGNPIDVTISMGIARLETEHDTPVLKRAMIALDQARASGIWRAEYDQNRYLQTSANLSLMGHLVSALEKRHLSVEYQPKYDLRSGSPIGVEALVRWNDPDRGRVFPDQFIPLAEETGHIESLTEYVLVESLKAQRALQEAGFDLKMSVNFSGRLVGNLKFAQTAMQHAESAVGALCFEITETAVMTNPDQGIAALQDFVDAGIEISIDDYGSGLSSLAYLKRLPAQELKIDKEFILEIDRSKRDAMLARSTINLAHSLGMKVTAEGIENETAVALLASMGCDIGQGYHLGRPMPLERLMQFLSANIDSGNSVDKDIGLSDVG